MKKYRLAPTSKGKDFRNTLVVSAFEILLELDTDDPKARDDELILVDENDDEVLRLKVADMEEEEEDVVRLVFRGIDMDTKYSLIRDYGAEEDGHQDPLFVNMSPREIIEIFEEDA